MSRTDIYKMMENRNINLSLGSNALDNTYNGAEFLGNLVNKFYEEKQNVSIPLSGFENTWLMEFADDASQVPITETYSLDDILEGKLCATPSVTYDFVADSPAGSPLSSSDEANYDLDELLSLSASPEKVLASKVDSSPIPFAEHMYAAPMLSPDTIVFSDGLDESSAFSPATSDSDGSFSSEGSAMDSEELFAQLLAGSYDFNAVLAESNDVFDAASTTVEVPLFTEPIQENESITEFSSAEKKESANRATPYPKIRKTPEQRLRKKAQNRTAATRYRSKKNQEMDVMFEEADVLESKNKELRSKVGGLKSEIEYLKNLMLDVIKARLSTGGSVPDISVLTN